MKVKIDKILTVQDLNEAASDIIAEANKDMVLPQNKEVKDFIDTHSNDEKWLFDYSIDNLLSKDDSLVLYILANYFSDNGKRKKFVKRKWGDGNTLYHLAIINASLKVVIVLTAKNAFPGTGGFIEWTRTGNPNSNGEGPFDVCCKQGNDDIFKILWARVNNTPSHKQHKDETSLTHACSSKNTFIIQTILNSIGLNSIKNYKALLRSVGSCMFGESVKRIFSDRYEGKLFNKPQIDTLHNFFSSKRISGKKHELDSCDDIEENKKLKHE
ncbi:MAG: hypothetical protein KAT71_00330 [Gammaproteobacteria bacterium]|nr:hypothetical protein [Gammaproteobacteria bacterium]